MSDLCAYFGYSRSGYYKSIKKVENINLNEELIVSWVHDYRRLMPRIGGKKLYWLLKEDLQSLGIKVGRDKFFEILRKYGLLVKKRKRYVNTTNSYHHYHKYKNKLKAVDLTGPNQAFVSDITYLRTMDGFVYLFLQTDAYSRRITGWDLSHSLSIEGAIKALKMTIKQSPNPEGSIHHSDRGVQYCSHAYVEILKSHKMQISMTEENHCYENSIAERVNGILKGEFFLDSTFKNIKMAKRAVKEAVDNYNNHRPHWSLELLTPNQVHHAA